MPTDLFEHADPPPGEAAPEFAPATERRPTQSWLDAVDLASRARLAKGMEEERKRWGQYFTGPRIAAFMASLPDLPEPASAPIRVLDPGAGTGILGIALCERLLDESGSRVHLVAVEPEPCARGLLRQMLEAMGAREPRLTFEILDADFLLLGQPLLGQRTLPCFDLAIANPPYFKMSPTLDRGGDAPNIYARFMEVTARLLKPGGQMVFIVPRSFASGVYFKCFRTRLHGSMSLERVHSFDSRRDAFRDQEVLQENTVVLYQKSQPQSAVVQVSVSQGADDLADIAFHEFPAARLFVPGDPERILHLPVPGDDPEANRMPRWPGRLRALGFEISTGPVVAFRATEHLRTAAEGEATVPLLWMQHVRADGVRWPLGTALRKPEHVRTDAPEKMLVPNRTYVLMRRFSAKEERRRLTATVLPGGQLPGRLLGLENHLNFIHRPGGELSLAEAWGIATVLSSALADRYFRSVSGNTQVNATEIRTMPFPDAATLRRLGELATTRAGGTPEDLLAEVLDG